MELRKRAPQKKLVDHQLTDRQQATIVEEFLAQDDVERMPGNMAFGLCRVKLRALLKEPRRE
jgi:hypothetical protein